MLSMPGTSCFSLKFSSANSRPYMLSPAYSSGRSKGEYVGQCFWQHWRRQSCGHGRTQPPGRFTSSVYAGLCVCLCLLLLLLLLMLRCSMHTLLEILIAAAARHATNITAKCI
jgi:hypothetical protein